MKISSLILLITIFSLIALPVDGQRRASTISVQIHREKPVPRTSIRIKFVEMVEDSRCPVDTECVWAGNAQIKIEVRGGRAGRQTFILNTILAPTSFKYSDYDIRLTDLIPHPRSNIRVDRNGYVAKIVVKRAGK